MHARYAEHDITGIVHAIGEILEATGSSMRGLAAEEASVLEALARVLSEIRRPPARPR